MTGFSARGWRRFAADAGTAAWAEAALADALRAAGDPEMQRLWLRHQGTWFVGVNALANAPDGSIAGVPLGGAAAAFARGLLPGSFDWDRAQVSICRRGYPRPWQGESTAAHAYRRNRDAAHLDGLHRHGPEGQRRLEEYHSFLLGIALNDPPAGAAPFVVWEGSHLMLRDAFSRALGALPPADWHRLDLSGIYQQTRREIFASCTRRELPLRRGEALVVHRHALHGMAPWPETLDGPQEGRIIAWFRPEAEMTRAAWLSGD